MLYLYVHPFYLTPRFYLPPTLNGVVTLRLMLRVLCALGLTGLLWCIYPPGGAFAGLQPSIRPSYITVMLPTGKASRLQVQNINGQQYGSILGLASAVFPGGRASEADCGISFKTERVRFAPASFFVALESNGEDRIAQMNMPVITINGKPLVPVPQFFYALQSLGVYTVRVGKNTVTLTMTGQVAADKQESAAPPKRNPPPQQIAAPVFPAPLPSNAPQPGRYALPTDLNRSEIQEEIAEPLQSGTLAAAVATAELRNAAITGLTAYRKDSITQIRFTANSDITAFQKPEIEKNEVVLRFVDIDNATRDLSSLSDVFPIQSVRVEKLREILVFRIRLRITPLSCAARRLSSRKVALDIVTPSSSSDGTVKSPLPGRGESGDKSTSKNNTSDKWKLDVVVLDPGHGGADEGATSTGGIHEKDVTLAIAKKTREFLKKLLPDVKVILTRTTDTFIELARRGQVANENNGKLFVSIHCNSMPTKPHPAHGFETYILRPGRNSDAVAVAERENSVIRFEKHHKQERLSEEQVIVATMAQAAFVKFSESFASFVQQEMKQRTTLVNRGVSQAGFIVLIGASMPNVLFETAFLSNDSDEEFITSERGQAKTAEALANAIRRYAREYAEATGK